MKLKPRSKQIRFLNDALSRQEGGRYLYSSPTGTGKCFAAGTMVLKYDGTIEKVENIQYGDMLMGPDSRPRIVTGTTCGRGMLYRVTPVKGMPYVVNEDHILSLKSSPEEKGQNHSVVNISVNEYLQLKSWRKHLLKGWRTGVDFPTRQVPMPAYIFGVWLGDGSSRQPAIYTPDSEVKAEVIAYAESIGGTVTVTQQSGCEQLYVNTGATKTIQNRMTKVLRELGVIQNKRIPDCFKCNDRETRLQLLAGIIDTDGSLSCGGYDYISVSEQLANDVSYLARSLGFAAYITFCKKTCGNNGVVGGYYRVSISGDLSILPVRVPRKKANPRLQVKSVLVTGISVEEIGYGDFYGFAVDGDHLFLLADFTVTHNSVCELILKEKLSNPILITPRIEIIAGMLDKLGENVEGLSTQKLADLAWSHRITTPIRLRNALAKGEMRFLPDQVIIDECFPAGTLVDGKPIEDIKVGDYVFACEPKTRTVVQRKVTKLYKNPAPDRMVQIIIQGQVIWATEGHPFYTERGWVCAGELTVDDHVLRYLPNGNVFDSQSETPEKERIDELLLSKMHHKGDICEGFGHNGGDKPQVCIGTDVGEQSNEKCQGTGTSISDVAEYRTQAESERGKWYRDVGMRENPERINRAKTLSSNYRREQGSGDYVSLRDRFSGTRVEVGDRDRRRVTQLIGTTGARQEERSILNWVRVDRITVHEFRSESQLREVCRDGFVYNIEVEEQHTYFAHDILVHNCHHSVADTYMDLDAYLPGRTWFGLTATPYRGTPRGTKELLDWWGGEVTPIYTLQEACVEGLYTMPNLEIWPLVDDDLIEIQNGDFKVSTIGDKTKPVLGEVVSRCKNFIYDTVLDIADYYGNHDNIYINTWDKPTLFAVSGTDVVNDLVERLNNAGLPAIGITQDTSREVRDRAFAECLECKVAIVQINVVSEGVDLAIRRIVDLRATLSPTFWFQMVGRCTRPGGNSDYICCNRNLERFAYLFEGMIPPAFIAKAQNAFEKPSSRNVVRAIGLEGIGRFKPAEIQLADGCLGQIYCLYNMDREKKVEWAVLLHPGNPEPLYVRKESTRNPATGMLDYGRWVRVPNLPPDLKGFASSPPKQLSEKQFGWWQKASLGKGIEVTAKATTKNFQAVPILCDTGTKFTMGGW